MHEPVDVVDLPGRRIGLGLRAEDHRHRRVEGPSQAGQGIRRESGVIGHSCGYQGMGQLEDEGPRAPEEHGPFSR